MRTSTFNWDHSTLRWDHPPLSETFHPYVRPSTLKWDPSPLSETIHQPHETRPPGGFGSVHLRGLFRLMCFPFYCKFNRKCFFMCTISWTLLTCLVGEKEQLMIWFSFYLWISKQWPCSETKSRSRVWEAMSLVQNTSYFSTFFLFIILFIIW